MRLAFVDVETTGTSPFRDRVIEIGIILVENNEVVETFSTLINPGSHVPPEILAFTGISSAQLESAPSFNSLKRDIFSLLEGSLFVAHNARFDYAFIKNEFAHCDVTFRAKPLCTVKLFRKLYPHLPHHNLDSLISTLNLDGQDRHRALPDAQVLWQFFQYLYHTFPADYIAKLTSDLANHSARPAQIDPQLIASLPESPGVYIFYDSQGAVLYVGKSKNIKSRCLQHFSSDYEIPTDLKLTQRAHSIEALPTAGDLGASLLESQLIKKLQPLLNRQLRQVHNLCLLVQKTTPAGYFAVEFASSADQDDFSPDRILGFYKSKTSAVQNLSELTKTHSLCDKLMGLQHTSGACFGHGLERCKGACIGAELPAFYNARFTAAFCASRLKAWPYRGPLTVTETDSTTGLTEQLVFDHWRHLGTLKSESDELPNSPSTFDYDTYKILSRHLRV